MSAPLQAAFLAGCTGPVAESRALAWGELSALLGTVEAGSKDGAAWMPAIIEPGPRKGERVQAITALVLDVEAKTRNDPETGIKTVIGPEPPDPAEMAAELDLLGWRFILHTTHSHHDPEILPADVRHARYRLVLVLSRPLQPAEVTPLGKHVASVLGISDCFDRGAVEPARLFYLPRAPEARLGAFEFHRGDGESLDVEALLSEARRAESALKTTTFKRLAPRSGSVIEAFNQAHDTGQLLEQAGYIPRGRNRWMHPESTTRVPGVRLLPESDPPKMFSSHGSDPLNDGHAHDAFDCYRILVHGGDTRTAVKAAAELMGMDAHRDYPQPESQPASNEDSEVDNVPCFALVPIDDLGHEDVPAPEYIVDAILPTGVPTLLGAHGGTGKSFLALVLAAYVATGRDFMGLRTQRVRVVFYSAEDGKKVIRWRLQKICRALDIDPGELSRWLVVLDVTDTDPALFREAQESGVRFGVLTVAFEALNRWACDTESRLVIIDNASDTYDANENERARVRAFMRGLARLARGIDGAVMLLAHVNRETATKGKGTEGYSGSTAWHNSARSRLFLSEDNGGLLLEHQKSNLGPKAEPLALAWEQGTLVRARDAVDRQEAETLTAKADADAVLCAIEAACASGDNVPTGRTGPATTWVYLKTLPELPEPLRARSGKERFWRALGRLQREGRIRQETFRDNYRNQRKKWIPCMGSGA